MDTVESLVSSARKRSVANLVAEQAAAGLCAALAGLLLLLLAGSDALAWPWLVVLFGGGAAWSAWRTWKGLPSLYQVAQRIDQRLNLSDTLSTAIAFAIKPDQASDSAWRLQRSAADNTSASVTPAQAAPYRLPRQAKWLGGLLAAIVILLGIRLGVLGTLDLRHPLVSGLSEFLPAKVADLAANGLAQGQNKPGPGEDENQGEENQEAKQENQQEDSPQDQQPQMGDNAQNNPQFGDDQQDPDDQQQNAQNDEGQDSDQQREGQDSNSESANKENESDSDQQQASNKQSNDQQSLLDKVRDSLSNLMNKLQQQKSGQNGQKQNQQQDGQKDQQQADQQGQGQQQSEQSAEKQQGASQKDPNANQDQNSSSESNQKAASKDPKTGHGTQDGKKEIQQAQQLEAMGKLTEIIGQRSKTVQGEIMLDRKSSQQHDLKTAYTEKDAFHREAGSDLRRDEIPVDLQHYVQEYFTKIRQTPAAASAQKK